MQMKKQEICGFSKMMLLQCLILFLGICGGIWINRYIYTYCNIYYTNMLYQKHQQYLLSFVFLYVIYCSI